MTRAVLFDFDFTLADSSAGIIECAQFALQAMGLDVASADAIRRTIGLSLSNSLTMLCGRDDPALCSEYTRLYLQRADEIMVPLTSLYPESPRVLRALRQRGIATAIVSTKYRYRIEAVLAAAGIADAVDVIVGGEDVAEHKPHPAGLERALLRLGVDSAAAMYVGDHPVDGVAARQAGVRFIRVNTGEEQGADAWAGIDAFATIDTIGALVDLCHVGTAFRRSWAG